MKSVISQLWSRSPFAGKRAAKSTDDVRPIEVRYYSRDEHNVSRDLISDNALKVLYRLNRAGYRALLVGGAVRDILLDKTPKDFDIATDATPEEVRELFRNCRLIGRRFRLAHVHFKGEVIEVATFRANHDGDEDGASIDDSGRIIRDNVYGSIEDDVWRRDFTINALYYDISDYRIIDYVGGVEDIRARQLHLIGDPAVRYREDPVRMLRAVRFAAKLGLEIDSDTRQAFDDYGPLLAEIAPARLFDETLKLFHSGNGSEAFSGLREFGLFAYLFPVVDSEIAVNEQAHRLITESLKNTDKRIAQEKSVTPAFIFAAILWGAARSEMTALMNDDHSPAQALGLAADRVIDEQIKTVAIPRRFTTIVRDIWFLQGRLEKPTRKRALRLLENPRFRAAYDFLILREKAGEELNDIGKWWTDIQDADKTERDKMINDLGSAPKRSRRPRTRRRAPRTV